MTWTPDEDSPGGGWSPESEGEEDAHPEAVLLTNTAFRLRVAPVAHERAKEGEQAFATFLADVPPEEAKPVAVGMLPSATVTALLGAGLFEEPAPLMMRATEAEDGQIQAVVSALLPQSALERFNRTLSAESEPWAASVPTTPDLVPGVDDGDGDDGDALMPFALGALLRFPENRKHPGDLAAEAADLFMTVLRGGAMDADAKKIDNLISGL